MNEYFTCDCGNEIIGMEYDKELGFLSIAFFTYGFKRKCPIWRRLWYMWQIIKNGHPYADMVILNRNELRKFYDKLTEVIDGI